MDMEKLKIKGVYTATSIKRSYIPNTNMRYSKCGTNNGWSQPIGAELLKDS